MIIGLKGDCKSELKKYAETVELYDEASKKINENSVTSPMYLFKAAHNSEKLKKNAEAFGLLRRNRISLPKFFYSKTKNMEKYITRSANKKN